MIVRILVGSLIAAGLLVLWHRGKQPYRHRNVRLGDLNRFFEILLKRGRPDGFLVITFPGRERGVEFVQIAKRVGRTKSAQLELAFPLAPWSEPYFGPLEAALSAAGVEYAVRPTAGGGDVRSFLYAPVSNAEAAQRVARIILQQVLGLGPEDALEVVFEGVNPG